MSAQKLTDDELHLTRDLNTRLLAIVDSVAARKGLTEEEAHAAKNASFIANGLNEMRQGHHEENAAEKNGHTPIP